MHVDSPPIPPATTDQLVEACLKGDQQAWEALVRQYRRRVFNIAYKFVGKHDQAEDLTQEIFLKVLKALQTFDRRANFKTWLFSISRNLCIDHYRSVRKERETVDSYVNFYDLSPVAKGPDPLSRLEQLDRRELLRRAMLELPVVLREAVLLRDIQEFSYQEITTRLKLPEGTVKSRISRGRHELARQIVRLERKQAAVVERQAMQPDANASGA